MSFDPIAARMHFPSLHRPSPRGQTPIFFDNPAGTQVAQQVIDGVTEYFLTMNANSGGTFATSQRTDAMVERVREQTRAFLNAPSSQEIVFGPNMTTLNFALSRAIGKTLKAGDEVVLTRMDHDANVSPWLRMADDHGLSVKWVDINTADCTLDLGSLEAALSERTRIVATVHASNAAGTVNPVGKIAEMAHAVGAYHVVDAVQSAPHIPLDVQAIGCDFLMCSSYKFFGPHLGILWGKYDLLEALPAYKVRPSHDETPNRWETGTGIYELISGLGGAFDYLSSLNPDGRPSAAPFVAYEQELAAHLMDVIRTQPGATIYGITDPAHADQRVPTVIFELAGYSPKAVAQHLAAHDIYVWDGNYYAVEIMGRLNKPDGLVRVGLAHYNTHAEIDRFAWALGKL
ncbi:MAG: cysteine desulfurase-like protein [Anaerolineae bacterium]|jgi:cysteine desulfurase family protein (TIGR01976 family)|nr:cysteine desulfurase-like protein [Anaerolineae bacterium]